MRVIRGSEDPVSVDRDVPLNPSASVGIAATAGGGGPLCEARDYGLLRTAAGSGRSRLGHSRLVHSRTILPEQISRGGVQSLNDAAWAGQVQYAVIDQRCRLLRPGVVYCPGPGELKLLDLLAVDLIERAVAPGAIRAPPVQPVAGSGVAQHGFGHRVEVFHLRPEPEAP